MNLRRHVSLRTAITLLFIILFSTTVLHQLMLQRHGMERLIEAENGPAGTYSAVNVARATCSGALLPSTK